MISLLERLHTWVGLFNLTILIVFAVAGLHVTFQPAPSERPAPIPGALEVPYEAPSDFTDAQVAEDVFARLAIPVVRPVPDWAIQRNADNVLVLDFYGPNGMHRATVLEREKAVRVEHARNTLGEFFTVMHTMTLYESPPDLRVKLWCLYVDLSIFSLLFMVVTGVWLWLRTRPKLWWAHAAFLSGTGLFAVLYALTR
jgi:hypothetical protein